MLEADYLPYFWKNCIVSSWRESKLAWARADRCEAQGSLSSRERSQSTCPAAYSFVTAHMARLKWFSDSDDGLDEEGAALKDAAVLADLNAMGKPSTKAVLKKGAAKAARGSLIAGSAAAAAAETAEAAAAEAAAARLAMPKLYTLTPTEVDKFLAMVAGLKSPETLVPGVKYMLDDAQEVYDLKKEDVESLSTRTRWVATQAMDDAIARLPRVCPGCS